MTGSPVSSPSPTPRPAAPLTVRRFRRSDWGWAQRWFEDETLDRELGPLDEEWLDHVLTETDGVELVVEEPGAGSGTGAPVALIGIVWGGADHGAPDLPHAITDLAVDPTRRGSSLGRRALDAALAWPGHPSNDTWVAYVDQENPGAFAFFTAVGWSHRGLDRDPSDEDAMHRFTRP
ncbi:MULTISPECIES: GNAT family N-acetyltransferase [Microbacterium]|uniref:GNAT family N-acetyltransferase n=1 Tax=Microbacterium TaxID=33882 RepID=UPI0030103467